MIGKMIPQKAAAKKGMIHAMSNKRSKTMTTITNPIDNLSARAEPPSV